MPNVSQHAEWMSLVEVSGPFLSIPVLERVFPQGLDRIETPLRQRVRRAYEEWRDVVDEDDLERDAIHVAWIRLVLEELLECENRVLKMSEDLPQSLSCEIPEHGITLHPDLAIIEPSNGESKTHLLIMIHPPDCNLETPIKNDHWPASPTERMTQLCRATGVKLGLVTNGECWMLVNAPTGSTSGYASWYSRLWQQEPITIRSFQSLLSVRRFFGPEDETLEAMFDASLEHQDEVTDRLGEQVRRAVEVLIQALDRADIDRNRELLRDVKPTELYEAGLTVMMRLVFLLCAEERNLLLLGDPTYDQHYAVSTLRAQLHEDADRSGLEVLEYRQDAWSRLLSIFRAIYGGVGHESLHMPALGGSLFDPDRFPFLEGRSKETSWQNTPAKPLPIDNRTVLLLLDALQVLEQRGGAQLLSYRALDIEQIGHVYEGLLEYTVARVPHTTLGLLGSEKAKNPNVGLDQIEAATDNGRDAIIPLLQETTQRSERALQNALDKNIDDETLSKLLLACGGDHELADRIRPYAFLLRTDNWKHPLIYEAKSFAITSGASRRETGTHYTPKSLTESIVAVTLEPIVYLGPSEGEPRASWRLRPSSELLNLKICDLAMGSGAFLVQVIRWLGERLVESWREEETEGRFVTVSGNVIDSPEDHELLPKDIEERLLIAMSLVAEKCIYGVDLNPMAVELAKLSIWLVTLSKGRPFGFLDHNLRSGNSLVGINDIEQLYYLDISLDKASSKLLFASKIDKAVSEAIQLRTEIRNRPIRDIRDIEIMKNLNGDTKQILKLPDLVANAFMAEVISANGKNVDATILSIEAGDALEGDEEGIHALKRRSQKFFSKDLPDNKRTIKPFNWPLEFPEVFFRENSGFEAIIGNPPFLGNKYWSSAIGDYIVSYAKCILGAKPGRSDLCALFFRRALPLLNHVGCFGLIGTESIREGDTRAVGLDEIIKEAKIFCAIPSMPWPGAANVTVSLVWVAKVYNGTVSLNGNKVDNIDGHLDSVTEFEKPAPLKRSKKGSKGCDNSKGDALILLEDSLWFENLKNTNSPFLRRYVTSKDLNDYNFQNKKRWVIHTLDYSLDKVKKECATTYKFLMEYVKEKRTSELLKGLPGLHKRWWQFNRPGAKLYKSIRRFDTCIIMPVVSKYVLTSRVPSSWVFTNKFIIFQESRVDIFGIFKSSPFKLWVQKYRGSLGGTMSISLKWGLNTYPYPINEVKDIGVCANEIDQLSQEITKSEGFGFTGLYNRINDKNFENEVVSKLRNLQKKLDQLVFNSYGWDDLALAHDFVETNCGVEFSLSLKLRDIVLDRLLKMNKSFQKI